MSSHTAGLEGKQRGPVHPIMGYTGPIDQGLEWFIRGIVSSRLLYFVTLKQNWASVEYILTSDWEYHMYKWGEWVLEKTLH